MQKKFASEAEYKRRDQEVRNTLNKTSEENNSSTLEKAQDLVDCFEKTKKQWSPIDCSVLINQYGPIQPEKESSRVAFKALSKDQIQAFAIRNQLFYNQNDFNKDSFLGMRKAAKLFDVNIGSRRLLKFLRDKKYITPQNRPYPKFIQSGFFTEVEKTSYNKRGLPRRYHTVPLISFSCIVAIWDEVKEAFTENGIYKDDHPDVYFGEMPIDKSGLEELWRLLDGHKTSINSIKTTSHD